MLALLGLPLVVACSLTVPDEQIENDLILHLQERGIPADRVTVRQVGVGDGWSDGAEGIAEYEVACATDVPCTPRLQRVLISYRKDANGAWEAFAAHPVDVGGKRLR